MANDDKLEERERLFLVYWSARREKEATVTYQLLSGLPVGMLFSLPIIGLLFTGRYWYKRADMIANSQVSFGVLIAAVFFIAIFVAVLYKRHQWDMKEQQYLEIRAKEKKNS